MRLLPLCSYVPRDLTGVAGTQKCFGRETSETEQDVTFGVITTVAAWMVRYASKLDMVRFMPASTVDRFFIACKLPDEARIGIWIATEVVKFDAHKPLSFRSQ
jgi:hypothetical protein